MVEERVNLRSRTESSPSPLPASPGKNTAVPHGEGAPRTEFGQRALLALAAASLVGGLLSSCTLITDVDRTKIPQDPANSGGNGGTGGSPDAGEGGSGAAPTRDAGTDAGPDADAVDADSGAPDASSPDASSPDAG